MAAPEGRGQKLPCSSHIAVDWPVSGPAGPSLDHLNSTTKGSQAEPAALTATQTCRVSGGTEVARDTVGLTPFLNQTTIHQTLKVYLNALDFWDFCSIL